MSATYKPRTTTTRREIQDFAVYYEAFCEANRDNDDKARQLWADLLLSAQEKLGIELASNTALAFFARRDFQ